MLYRLFRRGSEFFDVKNVTHAEIEIINENLIIYTEQHSLVIW